MRYYDDASDVFGIPAYMQGAQDDPYAYPAIDPQDMRTNPRRAAPPGRAPQHRRFSPEMEIALQVMRNALSGETEDQQFYQYLIGVAPSEEDKAIITSIREDEMNHYRMFRMIYAGITGKMLPAPNPEKFEMPAQYCDGLKQALMGEQNAVRKYRQALFAMTERRFINMLTEIITDEIRHATLYNYLYAKNGCSA